MTQLFQIKAVDVDEISVLCMLPTCYTVSHVREKYNFI
jgi:hypothetical protein